MEKTLDFETCYYCKERILDDEQTVINVSLSNELIARVVHVKCEETVVIDVSRRQKQIENATVRHDLTKRDRQLLDKCLLLTNYIVGHYKGRIDDEIIEALLKLQYGVVGYTKPAIISDEPYSVECIYKAFMACYEGVKNATYNAQYKSYSHLLNYIMSAVKNKLPYGYRKVQSYAHQQKVQEARRK